MVLRVLRALKSVLCALSYRYPRLLRCHVGSDTLFDNRRFFFQYIRLFPSAAARWRDLAAPKVKGQAALFPPAEGPAEPPPAAAVPVVPVVPAGPVGAGAAAAAAGAEAEAADPLN